MSTRAVSRRDPSSPGGFTTFGRRRSGVANRMLALWLTNRSPPTPGRPAVVLLHHFGGSRSTWADVTAALGDASLCVVPDLRGFGGSGAASRESTGDGKRFTVEDAADDVVGRCDALGVGRVVVVGHSMGGAGGDGRRRPPAGPGGGPGAGRAQPADARADDGRRAGDARRRPRRPVLGRADGRPDDRLAEAVTRPGGGGGGRHHGGRPRRLAGVGRRRQPAGPDGPGRRPRLPDDRPQRRPRRCHPDRRGGTGGGRPDQAGRRSSASPGPGTCCRWSGRTWSPTPSGERCPACLRGRRRSAASATWSTPTW